MAMVRTSTTYAARIERVVGHIADNLDADLDLDRLAGIACFSPFHFHRVYSGLMGETPADTVRRLRLQRAAGAVAKSDRPIGSIAREAGYGSLEAFSRAFAAAYGQPPATYRRSRAVFAPPPRGPSEVPIMYDVTLKRFPCARLVGLTHRGDYHAIGTTFEKVYAMAGPRGLVGPATRGFGVYHDDPESVPVAELRSFAGITVGPDVVVPPGLEVVEMPAVEAATIIHRGPYDQLDVPYRFLYGTWLPASGREPAGVPCFEAYLNDPRTLPPTEWLTEVHLPLAA